MCTTRYKPLPIGKHTPAPFAHMPCTTLWDWRAVKFILWKSQRTENLQAFDDKQELAWRILGTLPKLISMCALCLTT
jgi:hypothetical protein